MSFRKLFSSSRNRGRASDNTAHLDRDPSTLPSAPPRDRHEPPRGDSSGARTVASLTYRLISTTSTRSTPTGALTTIPDLKADPLGLSLLYAPENCHVADIIFVHGLGGSSRLTWCKDRRLDLFWPQEWLPCDEVLRSARIFSFGYNARFRSTSQSSAVGISDFAKNLLYDMLFGRDLQGKHLNIGEVPIIFVTHSMGGLVFKKAYLDAQLDARYATISRSVKSVVFLSTPHHGSDLATFLNRVLSINFGSSKQYVADLDEHSSFLRIINEEFRHASNDLQIFSFYETLKTPLGVSSALILGPESAKLGYPGEISRSLDADHHDVCKFDSPEDPSFRVVLGALKSLVSSESALGNQPTAEDTQKLRRLLSTSDSADHDLELFGGRRAEGTCQWVLKNPAVSSWLASPSSEILGFHGRPGRGKSVIASFLIQHLQQEGALVQYFFFKAGDESKRSVAALLGSLAFQVAQQVPTFRKSLLERADSGYKPKDAEWRSTWKKVFASHLFDMEFPHPLYWVIDGLDEAHSPHHVFDLLGDINGSKVPIKIAVTSRWSPTLSPAFDRMKSTVPTSIVSVDQDMTDLTMYVEKELLYCNWGEEITKQVIHQVLDQAEGSFLWIHLILGEVKVCNTEDDIRERLAELPPGMDGLYRRMEETITRIQRPADKNLARQLLTWGIHVRRPMAAEELTNALEPEVGRLLDVLQTTTRLCGHFIAIEGGKISLIHHTAREYLTTTTTLPFSLEAASGHAEIFKKSISSFLDKNLRSKLQRASPELFEYRATSWPHHLAAANLPEGGGEQLNLLAQFFTQTSVLTWIYILASLGQLKVLIEASRALYTFVRKKRKAESATDPSLRRIEDLECLEGWSRDLLRVLGKFGGSLSQTPEAIYTGVAPFCPTTSSIYAIFGTHQSGPLRVLGVSEDWGDCLARVSTGRETQATVVCCSGRYLAVGNNDGAILIWDSTTLHEVCTLNHGESVPRICFNAKGDRLATYGFRTTKIWSPQTGQLIQSISNQDGMQALCLQFVDGDATLLVGTDRRCVLQAQLTQEHPSWDMVDEDLLNDTATLQGTYIGSPSTLAFSPDGSKIAAAYRRFPLTIWSINPATILRRITQTPELGQASKQTPFVSRISWHPGGDEIMGIFMDGCSFRMNIIDGSYVKQRPTKGEMPSDIVCSPDGLVYAICGVDGTVKLFDYETSALIYQLKSEDWISALCFAPDGRRFFDTRGNYCSVWEPNVLIRLAGLDDDPPHSQAADENTSSIQQSQVASETFVDSSVPIVLVQPAPPGAAPMACLGGEDGAVELLNYETLERIRVGQTATRMSVEHVAWSDDGERLCYAELGGWTTVVQMEKGPDGRVSGTRRVERFKAKFDHSGGITQLVFLPGRSSLLLSSPSASRIWLLDPARADARGDLNTPQRRPGMWTAHPHFPDFLLFVTPYSVALHRRADLENVMSWSWRDGVDDGSLGLDRSKQSVLEQARSGPVDLSVVQEEVEEVRETFVKGYIMVRVARRAPSCKLRRRFFVFDAAAIDPESIPSAVEGGKSLLTPIDVPLGVSQAVEMPLDVLANGKLVFVDRSFWVCSWPLRSAKGVDDVQRHFFLPKDWVPLQNLELLHVTAGGEILCPHKGTVCVIQSPVGATW